MSDDIYRKLAEVLDTLPNGFPTTESGVEMQLLKKVFAPDEAELFCDLRLSFETAAQVAERTGRPLDGLEEKLIEMKNRGEILGINAEGTWIFRMMPWVFGIYEFQLPRLDREFAELNERGATIRCGFAGHAWIHSNDLHRKRMHTAGHLPPDSTQPDHSERFST